MAMFENGEFSGSYCECPAGNRSVKCCWHRLASLLLILFNQGESEFEKLYPSPIHNQHHLVACVRDDSSLICIFVKFNHIKDEELHETLEIRKKHAVSY